METPERKQLQAQAEAKLLQVLRGSNKFHSVQPFERVESAQACDAVLLVDVEQWGVRPSPFASGKNKPMEVGHLVFLPTRATARRQGVVEARPVVSLRQRANIGRYQNSPTTLVEDVRTSQERYCGIIANQLIY